MNDAMREAASRDCSGLSLGRRIVDLVVVASMGTRKGGLLPAQVNCRSARRNRSN